MARYCSYQNLTRFRPGCSVLPTPKFQDFPSYSFSKEPRPVLTPTPTFAHSPVLQLMGAFAGDFSMYKIVFLIPLFVYTEIKRPWAVIMDDVQKLGVGGNTGHNSLKKSRMGAINAIRGTYSSALLSFLNVWQPLRSCNTLIVECQSFHPFMTVGMWPSLLPWVWQPLGHGYVTSRNKYMAIYALIKN